MTIDDLIDYPLNEATGNLIACLCYVIHAEHSARRLAAASLQHDSHPQHSALVAKMDELTKELSRRVPISVVQEAPPYPVEPSKNCHLIDITRLRAELEKEIKYLRGELTHIAQSGNLPGAQLAEIAEQAVLAIPHERGQP